jgi:CTP:phosphocholine cytidylyltransferase-like protein
MYPNNWVEEDRDEIASAIVDSMVAEMTLEQMRNKVWDHYFDNVVMQDWSDLWMLAEEYTPDLIEKFRVVEDASH